MLLVAVLLTFATPTHTAQQFKNATDRTPIERDKNASSKNTATASLKLPYAEAGLTKRQAAAHLLDRFAFGARPNDIDKVVQMGLENWLMAQLNNAEPSPKLNEKLAAFKTLTMPASEIAALYPNPGILLAQAYKDGVISKSDTASANRAELRRKVLEYYKKEGVRPQRELIQELLSQKLLRAIYSENQLAEVLTDFWFNHFNVSITKNQAKGFVLSYERDAIRPFVFGKFREMLGATAKHPAMLLYLDNAQSSAPEGAQTTMTQTLNRYRKNPIAARRIDDAIAKNDAMNKEMQNEMPELLKQFIPKKGINENYARELMELHTLGVDGGYAQKDVVEVARALTGWTVFPRGKRAEKLRERLERGKAVGFIQEGEFLFRADAHDAGEKTILGVTFPAGGGKEEGEKVLDMLAAHRSTATFISTKLAKRFVSDAPPKSLIEKLSRTFLETSGDLKAMMITIAESPEFWSKDARRVKIKSPFELTVSALRAVDADVSNTRQVSRWIEKQGQPLYAYQAPTGYPDRAEAWINTGSLLNRMNFGLNLALGRIKGVKLDLSALNKNREPESAEDALKTYAALLMPERDLSETLRLLTPVIRDPQFAEKIAKAIPPAQPSKKPAMQSLDGLPFDEALIREFLADDDSTDEPTQAMTSKEAELANIVGTILGSPEFQRR